MKSRLKTFIFILTIVGLAYALRPMTVYACSCGEPITAKEALEVSDAVFFGKVIAKKDIETDAIGGRNAVLFDVTSIWKGKPQPYITVYSDDCGVPYEVGKEDLVYASIRADNNLYSDPCSHYRPEGSTMDLTELGVGSPPLSQEVVVEQTRLYDAEQALFKPSDSQSIFFVSAGASILVVVCLLLLVRFIVAKRKITA